METTKKMTIEECRDSLLLKGVECHSRYHERPDRCRYCECPEELQQVGMSCVLEEKATLETFLEDLNLSKDPGFDIFTITAIEED